MTLAVNADISNREDTQWRPERYGSRQSLHSRAKAKAEKLNTATCRESCFGVLVSQAELGEMSRWLKTTQV